MNPLPARGLVKMPKSQQLILILCNPFRNPSYKAAPLLCSAGLFLTLLDGRIQGFGLFSIQLSKRHQSPDPNSWARDCFPKLEQIDTFTTKIRHGLDGLFQLNEEMEWDEEFLDWEAVLTLLEFQIWDWISNFRITGFSKLLPPKNQLGGSGKNQLSENGTQSWKVFLCFKTYNPALHKRARKSSTAPVQLHLFSYQPPLTHLSHTKAAFRHYLCTKFVLF